MTNPLKGSLTPYDCLAAALCGAPGAGVLGAAALRALLIKKEDEKRGISQPHGKVRK